MIHSYWAFVLLQAKTAHLEVHRSEQGKGKKLEFANSKTTFDLIYRLWNSVKALCHLDIATLGQIYFIKEAQIFFFYLHFAVS